jgi:DUF3014 family protein
MVDPSQEDPGKGRSNLEDGAWGRTEWLLTALAVAVLAGGLAFWWVRRTPPPPPPTLAEPAPPPPPAAAPPTGPAPAPAPTTPTDATRAALEAVSAHPDYRAWLSAGDVLNRWAVVTDNLAEGVSPRRVLEFLAPQKPFTVAQRGADAVIAPESYRRYDRFADAVASVDPAAFAAAYRALHPVLEAAWRTLGDPHGSLDAVAARALSRLAAAPVVEGDVLVVPGGPVLYLFADPALEARDAVDKHLLRMGPRNARLVKAKAAALLKALELKPAPAR